MDDFQTVLRVLDSVGVFGAGVGFLWLLYKGILVWGRDCERALSQCDGNLDVCEEQVRTYIAETRTRLERAEQRLEALMGDGR